MEKKRSEDAHAVVLPAFDTTALSDQVKRFLERGGCSILLGETREEYVARKVSGSRRRAENAETFRRVTREAAGLAKDVLVAVDQEIGGICRLHDLVQAFPGKDRLAGMESGHFEKVAFSIASAAKELGVTCFLGPVLDVVTGRNPWLAERTWSQDPEEVARISSAFVRGVQSAGVAATAKHFPGFHHIELDPAVEAGALVDEAPDAFTRGFLPFAAAIDSHVELVMTGPAIVTAFDSERPASLSRKVIGMLKKQFGFKGVILSDDLDSKATLGDASVEGAAVEALNAGADFLLVGDMGDQLERVVNAISLAVESGMLAEERLHEAAVKVRFLARKYGAEV